MSGTSERLEKDLAALEQSTVAIAAEFSNAYQDYLTVLGTALSQQLILATYYICTQGYPESFLRLSWERRHELQQALRQLGDRARSQLLNLLTVEQSTEQSAGDSSDAQSSIEEWIQLSESAPGSESAVEVATLPEIDTDGDRVDEAYDPPWQDDLGEGGEDAFIPSAEEPFQLGDDPASSEQSSSSEPEKIVPLEAVTATEDLFRWQAHLEISIKKLLQQISRQANLALRQANVLPRHLPEAVLEAAAKAEASTDSAAGPPNLLMFRLETEREKDAKPAEVLRLMAIHLRLVEIELADSATMTSRQQLRDLIGRGKKLHRDRSKIQRTLAIAQAEDAWRSSWSTE